MWNLTVYSDVNSVHSENRRGGNRCKRGDDGELGGEELPMIRGASVSLVKSWLTSTVSSKVALSVRATLLTSTLSSNVALSVNATSLTGSIILSPSFPSSTMHVITGAMTGSSYPTRFFSHRFAETHEVRETPQLDSAENSHP